MAKKEPNIIRRLFGRGDQLERMRERSILEQAYEEDVAHAEETAFDKLTEN